MWMESKCSQADPIPVINIAGDVNECCPSNCTGNTILLLLTADVVYVVLCRS